MRGAEPGATGTKGKRKKKREDGMELSQRLDHKKERK